MSKTNIIHNKDGAALIYVIIALVVTTILLASVSMIFGSNLRQAVNQEERLKAHYLVLAGIDVTKSTLLSPLYVDNTNVERNMLYRIKKDSPKYDFLEDTIDIEGHDVNIVVRYNSSHEEVTIESSTLLDTGVSYNLKLIMDVSGTTFSERWE